jgi:hypothetical protein
MPFQDFLSTAELKVLFAEEITAAGGKVSDTYEDGARLFTRSILPQVREVRPADRVQGGVALRASAQQVCVHPYIFRQVCSNGAIMAQAIQTRHITADEVESPEEAAAAVRLAVQACCEAEAFSAAAEAMRSTGERQADMALNLLPVLSRLPGGMASQAARAVMERFLQDADRSQFALMNAVTSVARDTRDPDLRWRLEELGGGIAVGRTPVLQPDDRAAAVLVG